MTRKRSVNIVVVGDPGVGKTSLILAVATEAFPEHPVPTLPPTSLPAELTPDGVPSLVVDTSSRPEDRPVLESQCLKADVVLLLWSKESDESLQRLSDHWLPELRRMGVGVPIILVGTRQDLAPDQEKQSLQQAIQPLMMRFKEIEACLECSAKKLQFVGDVFYYALKAVIHPTGPLFNTHTNQLRPACIKALKRIFMLCDLDSDGILSDAELNTFQVHCWKSPLKPSELEGIKKVVSDKMPNGVSNSGLTMAGFLFLHSLFIERGRLETTWTVLRSYGYDDSLKLKDEILDALNFSAGPDQVVELTQKGREFLTYCFQKFDHDQDGALSPPEQEDMFSTAPCSPWEGPDWDSVMVETARSGALTCGGFLSKWAYTTVKDPRTTLAHIMYLGYKGDPGLCFALSKRRRQERKGDPGNRSVLQCYVFGSAGSGKTGLLQGFVGLPHSDTEATSRPAPIAISTVDCTDAPPRTLILREVADETASKMLGTSSEERGSWLAACDVAAVVFDSSSTESFREAHKLLLQVATASGDSLPCLLIAAKDDLGMSQELVQECAAACEVLRMPSPVQVSMRVGETGSVYSSIAAAASHPQDFVPETPSLKAAREYRQTLQKCLLYAGAGVVGWAACYVVYQRIVKRNK